jgi:hypothetical protein
MTRIQVAPPGTPLDGEGWHDPWPWMVLAWDIHGGRPAWAVRRGDVLLATGLPLTDTEPWPE